MADKLHKEPVSLSFHDNKAKLVREEKFEGKNFWVLPVVLMTAGVHNNVLYPAEENSKVPQGWNGIPLCTPDHPEKDGKRIQANIPEVLEKQGIGKLFNCNSDDTGKIKGEAWVDQEKVNLICPDLGKKIKNNEQIEVSTGLFTDDEMTPGEWNGEKYECIARNYVPDHLAVLPFGIGACSWSDGAGMPRTNKENNVKQTILNALKTLGIDHLIEKVFVSAPAPATEPTLKLNAGELHSSKMEQARKQLGETKDYMSAWPMDSDDECIYCEHWSEKGNADGTITRGNKILAFPYTSKEGKITLGTEPKEVKRVVTYQTNEQQPNKEKEHMDQKTPTTPEVKTNTEQVPAKVEAAKVEAPTVIQLTPAELDARITAAVTTALNTNSKSTVIASIKANKANVLPDAALAAMTADELAVYAKTLPTPDYSAGSPDVKTNSDDIPEMPSCMLASDKK